MSSPSPRRCLALALAAAGLCLAAQVGAQSMARQESGLHAIAKESPRFAQTGDVLALGEARHALALDAELGFDEFARAAGGTWSAQVDARTGFVSSIDGSGIPWLTGPGNDLVASGSTTLAELDARARALARVLGKTMGFDADALVLNEGRSGHPAPHVWFVDYDVVAGGHRIEGARVVFVVNSGNLISVGTENLPAVGAAAPVDRIGLAGALEVLVGVQTEIGVRGPGVAVMAGMNAAPVRIERPVEGHAGDFVDRRLAGNGMVLRGAH